MHVISLTVNGQSRTADVSPDTPLLWVLREDLDCRGVKFGCGAGLCGACTVHLDGEAARSCQVPVGEVGQRTIVTIEGLAESSSIQANGLHPVQDAWIADQVPQCGYCQPGMIMAAAALLRQNPHPDETAIRAAITNICRCGTYPRIVKAIERAAKG